MPDFWLSDLKWWAEVKSDLPSKEEMEKCRRLAMLGKHQTVILMGEPYTGEFAVYFFDPDGHEGFDAKSDFSTEILFMMFLGKKPEEFERACTAARQARFESYSR